MKEGWEERGETRKMGRGRREGKRQLLATTYFVSHVILLPHLLLFHFPSISPFLSHPLPSLRLFRLEMWSE